MVVLYLINNISHRNNCIPSFLHTYLYNRYYRRTHTHVLTKIIIISYDAFDKDDGHYVHEHLYTNKYI